MANSLLTPTVIAKEALFQLENNVVMSGLVHRQYKKEFVKVGDTVTIRKPVKFTVTDGATRSNQDVTEQSDTIVINKRKHVSWKFSTQDLTLTIEEMSKRYIKPAMIVLANQVDADLCALYNDLYLKAGTPGTTPDAFSYLADMAEAMDDAAIPDDGMRRLVLNPAARWSLADALKGVSHEGMAEGLIRKGFLGTLANFKVFGDQNIVRHTTGAFTTGSTPLVKGASQTGASLITDGWAVSTAVIKDGDQFTIAGVNSVNPVSKADTGKLQVFTATADGSSDGSGDLTISITPSITTSGAYQTVSAGPANDAAITMVGSESTAYPQNLAFHKNALALVTVPLEMPDSAGFKARVQHNGISMRLVKDYDIDNDDEIIRIDILYGVKAIYNDLGGRLWG